MRTNLLAPIALVFSLVACGTDAPPAQQPDAAANCGGACGPGTVCSAGRCVPLDGPEQPDAVPLDAHQPAPDAAPLDAAPDLVALDAADALEVDAAAPPPPDAAPDACGDTSNDPMHCGACGRVCSFPNATARCAAGRCELGACVPGFADCDGSNANGCETDTGEGANCGACGNRCPMSGRCAGGRCETGCSAGLSWCFGDCVDLAFGRGFPAQHCGACGRSCPRGQMCIAGACANPCPAGRLYCNSNIDLAIACVDVAVGRPTATGAEHCGMCGHSCTAPLVCSRGMCLR